MTTAQLSRKQIDAIFEDATDSSTYILELFAAVVPRWDDVARLEDSGACNDKTWQYICQKAIDHDNAKQANTPSRERLMPGGAWMNYGFSVLPSSAKGSVPDWTVRTPVAIYA